MKKLRGPGFRYILSLFSMLIIWSTGDLHILGDRSHHQLVPRQHIIDSPLDHNCSDDAHHNEKYDHDEQSCPLCLMADQNQGTLPLKAFAGLPVPEAENVLPPQTVVIETAFCAVPRTRAPPVFSIA